MSRGSRGQPGEPAAGTPFWHGQIWTARAQRAARGVAVAGVLAVSGTATGLLVVPAQAWAQTESALTAFRGGRYQEAIEYWEGELRAGRATAEQARHLADALIEVGRYDDAIEMAQRVRLGSDGHEIANRLGEALRARGCAEAAREAFEFAIRAQAPDALRAELNLAVLDWESGHRERAMRSFDGFIGRYNSSSTLSSEDLTAVAVGLSMLGRDDPDWFHDAVRAFDEAIAADPDNLEPRLLLGELFLAKYNSGEAKALIEEVLRANPKHPRALLADARRLHFDGAGEAIERAQKALEINPNLVAAKTFMARLLIAGEQYAAATGEAQAALEIDPQSLEALSMLASVSYLQGDTVGFEAFARRALEINPQYGELFRVVAEMAVQTRLYADAVELAGRAVKIDPESWTSYGVLGINQLRIGAIEEGRQNLERAFAGDPFNVWFKNTLDLLDTSEHYRTRSSQSFDLIVEQDRADLLALYMGPLADEALETLASKYGYRPAERVRVEVFARHADFSVRTVGLAGLGALGVAFGPVIAINAPGAAGLGPFNWGSTLWHEIAHVVTLGASGSRVPRWLTEGLSVFEERRARPAWGEEPDPGFLTAYLEGKLLPVSRINEGFVRPSYPEHVVHSYLQASLVCEFIVQEHGFEAIRDMLAGYAAGKQTPEIVRQVLGLSPGELDARFEEFLRQRYAARLAVLRPSVQRRLAHAADPQQRPASVPLDELESRIREHADDFVSRLQLGIRWYEQQQDEKAIVHLQAARDLFPEHAGPDSAYAYLARIYEQRGDLEQAVRELRQMTSYNETAYEAHAKLGELLLALGHDGEAADVLGGAMYIDLSDAAVHDRLAALNQAAGDWNGAVRERRAVVALHPVDRAQALYRLAVAYRGAGEASAARRAVLEALETAPSYRLAQELLLQLRSETDGETR